MKKQGIILLSCVLIILSVKCAAQTDSQKQLLWDFFMVRGVGVINNWAHPLYSRTKSMTVVDVSTDYVLVKIHYNGNFEDFECSYKININEIGVFSGITSLVCGNIFTPCFTASDWAKENLVHLYEADTTTRRQTESYVGKTIKFFTAKDFCLLDLNYYWIKDGYYSAY